MRGSLGWLVLCRKLLLSPYSFTGSRYDLILANPPFVMTPPGLEGTLTSRAGPVGNDFAVMLLSRLPALLNEGGEAYLFLLQFETAGEPLIVAERALRGLSASLTPVQQEATPFAVYREAYLERFAGYSEPIAIWADALTRRHGPDLAVQHYVMRLCLPRADAPAGWCITDDLAEAYGDGFAYAPSDHKDLALGRVAENLVLPRRLEA